MATPSSTIFTTDGARRDALNAIAQATHKDRNAVLTEAIDAYLDIQRWQAEAREFAIDEEVEAAFAGRR